MIISLNDENIIIKNDKKAIYDVTKFDLNGTTIEIEGYAVIENLITTLEDRMRKSIYFFPKESKKKQVNENGENEEYIDNSPLIFPLENCLLTDLTLSAEEQTKFQSYGSSAIGFKGKIDLSNVNNKALCEGTYTVYLKLEQFSDDSDEFKYEKILPLWTLKELVDQKHFSVKIADETPNQVLKYNLNILFDDYRRTIYIQNTLIQNYNPKAFARFQIREKSNKKIEAFKRRYFKLMYILFSKLPINKKKVVFASDSRDELNGNLFFIYEEMKKRDLKLKYKFLLNKTIEQKKSIFKLTKMAYQFATAKVILLDDFYPLIYPVNIRRNSDLIQTWHAAGAFKTFGFSRLGRPGGPPVWSRNHRNYTKVAVSSEDVRPHYAEGFGVDIEKVYATGVPRSDIFFDEKYKQFVKQKFYENYPQLKGKKIILFAPTFRGNGQSSAYYPYNKLDLKSIYGKLKDEYVFLFKIHPFVNNKLEIPKEYSDFYYDFTHIREINDLLLITDHLITDYSSVCFEYALLKKPMSFFAFDVDEYIKSRDFYYNYYEFIPGPLVKTSEELIEEIQKNQIDEEKLTKFVEKFFHPDLGHASERVVDDLIIPSLESWNDDNTQEKEKYTIPNSREELFERTFGEKEL